MGYHTWLHLQKCLLGRRLWAGTPRSVNLSGHVELLPGLETQWDIPGAHEDQGHSSYSAGVFPGYRRDEPRIDRSLARLQQRFLPTGVREELLSFHDLSTINLRGSSWSRKLRDSFLTIVFMETEFVGTRRQEAPGLGDCRRNLRLSLGRFVQSPEVLQGSIA